MADYIEREAAIDAIINDHPDLIFYSKREVIECISAEPAADVAPVVHCRNCQSHHWEQEPCHGKTVHYCEKLKAEVWPDFFCGYGKRKDGEG